MPVHQFSLLVQSAGTALLFIVFVLLYQQIKRKAFLDWIASWAFLLCGLSGARPVALHRSEPRVLLLRPLLSPFPRGLPPPRGASLSRRAAPIEPVRAPPGFPGGGALVVDVRRRGGGRGPLDSDHPLDRHRLRRDLARVRDHAGLSRRKAPSLGFVSALGGGARGLRLRPGPIRNSRPDARALRVLELPRNVSRDDDCRRRHHSPLRSEPGPPRRQRCTSSCLPKSS